MAANPKASRKRGAPAENPAADLPYEQWTVPHLKKACKDAGIRGISGKKHSQLIEMLRRGSA